LKPIFTFLVVMTLTLFLSNTFAEPITFEEFMKSYQPLLDAAQGKPAKKQAEIGLKLDDVVCSADKVHMLKLSANYVACVKKSSVDKLIDRQWGITRDTTDRLSYAREWECSDRYLIITGNDKPTKSEIIKKFRMTVMDFSQEPVFWKKIFIVHDHLPIELQTNGKFTEEQKSLIIQELEKIDKVRKVQRENGACY